MEIKNRVSISIMGEEYVIRGNSSSEHLKRVARYVDAIMRRLHEQNPGVSRHKLAVLVSINLADEVLRAKDPDHYPDQSKETGEENELV